MAGKLFLQEHDKRKNNRKSIFQIGQVSQTVLLKNQIKNVKKNRKLKAKPVKLAELRLCQPRLTSAITGLKDFGSE